MALRGEQEHSGTGPFGSVIERTKDIPDLARRMGTRAFVRTQQAASQLPPLPAPVAKFTRHFAPGGRVYEGLEKWWRRDPIVRFVSANLLRRILVSNLLGFIILFGGILYLNQNSSWLLTAKREALKVQGEIIAAAIASGAKVESGGIVLDSNNLPTPKSTKAPFRDDGFAKLELSIQPQRIAPILKRLTQPTQTRGRVYDRNGDLAVDTNWILRRGSLSSRAPKGDVGRPTTKNIWTHLRRFLIGKKMQVYKEIGSANGQLYPEVRHALKGNAQGMLLLNRKGQQMVSMAVPIRRRKEVLGVLLLSTSPGAVDKVLAKERRAIWPLAALALLATIVTSLLLARTVAGPMQRLSNAAQAVRKDINTHHDLPDYSNRKDEVGQLTGAFQAMTDSLYQRIEASEKFAADIAHELRNPLTAASSTAQSLEYAKTDEQREQLVQQIQHELKRLNKLITDVSSASRLDAELARQSQDPVPLRTVLENIVAIFDNKASECGCKLFLDLPENSEQFVVHGNEGRLAQVLTNLIDNAISFSPDDGEVRVTIQIQGDDIEVRVEDEGPGIDEDKLEAVFSRFYTYRPTSESSRGNNSGLGLSISQEIITAHGGRIWAENLYRDKVKDSGEPPGKPLGARFLFRLPASPTTQRGNNNGARRANS